MRTIRKVGDGASPRLYFGDRRVYAHYGNGRKERVWYFSQQFGPLVAGDDVGKAWIPVLELKDYRGIYFGDGNPVKF